MNSQNYLIDALDIVLGWDISDELIPLALVNQAQLMAGFDCESNFDDEADWLSPESFVAFS